MKVDGVPHRALESNGDDGAVRILDQTRLPHEIVWRPLATLEDAAEAIETMRVRGAPLIGATAAWGMALALGERADDDALEAAADRLLATRPTAVNLRWAVDRVRAHVAPREAAERASAARALAAAIADEDVERNRLLGEHGLALLREAAARKDGAPLEVLTHCNAGWLATVDWGTATAPLYRAHQEGIPLHVWVDETRPRNQGAALTAWELGQEGVPHTLVVDNAGGHLMQRGRVDLCLVGTDRTTGRGDVANKIGTYLKALAARDNDVPFYVALPSATLDATIEDGLADIPIEERAAEEVTHVTGRADDGRVVRVRTAAEGTPAANPAFDVTPAHLVTGLVTEHGVVPATPEGLAALTRPATAP